MRAGSVHLRTVPGDEWVRVANALRVIDSRLPAQLRRAMKKAAKNAVDEAKHEALTIPVVRSSRKKASGLRRRVARGVSVRVATGRLTDVSYMRIITSMPTRDQAMLPRGLDAVTLPNKGWRHPVFGNRDHWVQQHTGRPWFRQTIAENKDDIRRELVDVLEDARNIIAARGGKFRL